MKIYLCVSDTRKRSCRSVTVVDSYRNCRELMAYLNYYSYSLRTYEYKGKKEKETALKIFSAVPDTSCLDDIVVKKEGERYGKVSAWILG